ncbi:hypothetical protein QTN47_23085 [Danxiaibacter flavus]|uniref:Uncharacterized protein n=1 Tax=Danxiaibacter flavus TaxID=3049108 RepID=A0ABV3ZLL8_9BACT|nr:hypothetical protein QNM32_23090 [Chitinophagaceae bacterium DXS]
MKPLQFPYKVLLANIVVAIIFSFLYILSQKSGPRDGFGIIFGLTCLLSGLINLFLGLVFIFIKERDWRVGFFISSAVLFVLSGISCGSSF